jgi:hypothetical protein
MTTSGAPAIATSHTTTNQASSSPAPSQDVDQKDSRAASSRAAVARRRRLARAATLLGAVLVTTVCFLLARVAGADFTITDPGAGQVPHTFVALEMANVTAIIGVLGWLTLATLERWTRRSRMIWGTLAVGIVALSLVPIWIVQATTATRLSLAVLHVVVGIALWPMLHFGPKNGQLSDQRRVTSDQRPGR